MFESYFEMHRCYQSVTPTINLYLKQKWDAIEFDNHRNRIKTAKPEVDSKPPRTFMHLHLKLRKLQKEQERLSLIQRDNQILQDRIACIMRSRGRLDNENLNYRQKSSNTTYRQMEMIRLAHENQAIIQRLMMVDPEYNHLRMEDEYRIHARHRQNIQKFPHWAQKETQVVGQTRHLAGRGRGKCFHDQKSSTSKKNTVSLEEPSYESQENTYYSQEGYGNQSANSLYRNTRMYSYSTDPQERPPFRQYPSYFQIVDIQTGNQHVVSEKQHSTSAQLDYDGASSHERSHFDKNCAGQIKSVSHSDSLNHFENMKRYNSYEIQNAQFDIEKQEKEEFFHYYAVNSDKEKTNAAAISRPSSSSSVNLPSLKAFSQQKSSESIEINYNKDTRERKRDDSEFTHYYKQEQQQILEQLRESDYRHEMQINYGMTHKQEAGDLGPIDNSTSSVDESGNEGDSETSRESLDNIIIRTGPLPTGTTQRSEPSETRGGQVSSKASFFISSSNQINEENPQENNSLNITDSKEASILTRYPDTSEERIFHGNTHSYDNLITVDHDQNTLNSEFRILTVDDHRINKLEEYQMQSKNALSKELYNEKGKPNKNRMDHYQEESVPTNVDTVQELHSQEESVPTNVDTVQELHSQEELVPTNVDTVQELHSQEESVPTNVDTVQELRSQEELVPTNVDTVQELHSQEELVPTNVDTVQELHSRVMFIKKDYADEKKKTQGKVNGNTKKKVSVHKDENTKSKATFLPEKLEGHLILSSDTDNKAQSVKFYKEIILESEQQLLSEHEQDFDFKRRLEVEYGSQKNYKIRNKPIGGSQKILTCSERKRPTDMKQKFKDYKSVVLDGTDEKELLNNQKDPVNRELREEPSDAVTSHFEQQTLSLQTLLTAKTTKDKNISFIKSAEKFQEELNSYSEYKFLSGQNQDNNDSEISLAGTRHEPQKNYETENISIVQNQAEPSKTNLVTNFLQKDTDRSTAAIITHPEQQMLAKQNQDIEIRRTATTEHNFESRDILLVENDACNKEVSHALQHNVGFASSQNQSDNHTEILTLNNLTVTEASLSQEEPDKNLHENIVVSNVQRIPIQQNLESKEELEIADRFQKELVVDSETKIPSNLNNIFENEGILLLNDEPYIRNSLLTGEQTGEEGQPEVHYVELRVEPVEAFRDNRCIKKETLIDDDVLEDHDKNGREKNKIQEVVTESEMNHEILSTSKLETEKESMSVVFDKESTNQNLKVISGINILWDISKTINKNIDDASKISETFNQETKEEGNKLITELTKTFSEFKEKYNPNTTQVIENRTEEHEEVVPTKKYNKPEGKVIEQSNKMFNENSENILDERNDDGANVLQMDHNNEEKLKSLRESKCGSQYESNVQEQRTEYFAQNLNNLINESGTKHKFCQGTFERITESEEKDSDFYRTSEDDRFGTINNKIESLHFSSQKGDNIESLQTYALVAHQSVRVNVTTTDRECNAPKCELETKYRSINLEHHSNKNASINEEYAYTN